MSRGARKGDSPGAGHRVGHGVVTFVSPPFFAPWRGFWVVRAFGGSGRVVHGREREEEGRRREGEEKRERRRKREGRKEREGKRGPGPAAPPKFFETRFNPFSRPCLGILLPFWDSTHRDLPAGEVSAGSGASTRRSKKAGRRGLGPPAWPIRKTTRPPPPNARTTRPERNAGVKLGVKSVTLWRRGDINDTRDGPEAPVGDTIVTLLKP